MDDQTIRDWDLSHVWRPYTSSIDHQANIDPIVVGAEGSFFYTSEGEKLFDASGSWWCKNLGHRHPKVVEAIKKQSDRMLHVPLAAMTHPQAAELAARLRDVAPKGLTRSFFSDNGSTAVEVGLKIAVQFFAQQGSPSKKGFLRLPGAYHGDTVAAMSVSGVDLFSSPFSSLLFESQTTESNPDEVGWEAVFSELCAMVEEQARDLAAVIVEPCVQGAGGMRMYEPRLLQELKAACAASDVLLIADEIFTGFGRTGPMWGCDHAQVSPDILLTAKGLSAGELPFSATMVTDYIYQGFSGDKTKALLHGHTFCGNPLGAAVANAVLRVYEDEKVLEQAAATSEKLKSLWAALEEVDGISKVRTFGMVAACQIGSDEGYLGTLGWDIHRAALKRGVHIRPLGNTLYLTPSLLTKTEDLTFAIDQIKASCEEVFALL